MDAPIEPLPPQIAPLIHNPQFKEFYWRKGTPNVSKRFSRDVDGNVITFNFSHMPLTCLPDWIQEFPTVKSLNFYESTLSALPPWITELPELVNIDLSNVETISVDSLVPLFKSGNGPEMYPIMIGIHLIDF